MGRTPCCDKGKVKRGPWSPEEDMVLRNYIESHGTGGNWIALPQKAGLSRCGKSCRLRWLNYLRPDIKHGGFTKEEDDAICRMYSSIGSRWSVIASHLSGRTDNEVKNHWNIKLKKRMKTAQVTNSNTTATPTGQSPSSSTVKNEASSNEPWFDFSSVVAAVTNSNTTATPTGQSPSSSTVKNEASSNEPWFDFSSVVAAEDSSGSGFFSNWY